MANYRFHFMMLVKDFVRSQLNCVWNIYHKIESKFKFELKQFVNKKQVETRVILNLIPI